MNRHYNVLVFPGGTEIALEIHNSLSECKDITLFSAGSDVPNHASYVFEHHFSVSDIHTKGWLEQLNNIIDENRIDYIFPAYDDIIVALSQNQHNLNATVLTAPLQTCLITRSKTKTYAHFRDLLPTPQQYTNQSQVDTYPVFIKPDAGQGSQGIHVIHDAEELSKFSTELSDNIILEFLPGAEYTIDCFSDRDLGLLFCCGRQRIRTKAGISMNSKIVYDPCFQKFAEIINEHLSMRGAWFFQVKRDRQGVCKLMEIAPRIAGTMALNRVRGVNFPLLSIFEAERLPLQILVNPEDVEIDRALKNRYRHSIVYKTVYMDLDDTLILNGRVNPRVAAFIFQCLNRQIKLILLTKHQGDLQQVLIQYRISSLFDEIIHIPKSDSKANYIDAGSAIFVDDSFIERLSVYQQHHIPTFDCSMLELLIDERV